MTTHESITLHAVSGGFFNEDGYVASTEDGQELATIAKHGTHYRITYTHERVPESRRHDATKYRSLKSMMPALEYAAKWIAVVALALVTIPTFAHPVYPPDDYLAGCAIAHYDDGSRYAECPEDGAVLVYDADGNRYVNESGAPIHGAGWYVLE